MKKLIALLLTLALLALPLAGLSEALPDGTADGIADDTAEAPEEAPEAVEDTVEDEVPEQDVVSLEEPVAEAEDIIIGDTGETEEVVEELIPEPADTDLATLEIGATVNGFVLKETRDFPLIGAVVYRFEHERLGSELYYIANGDTNRVFKLAFRTQAIDNTGLPHVFEHATLSGSEKYPSKDLWFNLAYGSYNTYMNAYTQSTYTAYPVASLSEAQLLRLADLYTDCCLNPSIMQDESIYREEAWRYRMDTPESPLTIEGTVYSEMMGYHDLKSQAYLNDTRLILPGSYTGNVFGGDPDYIPDMTYEALKDYHDTYYHPCNCTAYLYGKLEHYEDFLALLDAAYAPFERREIQMVNEDYTPITGPVEGDFASPAEAGTLTENASVVLYSFLCPGLKDDPQAVIQMRIMAGLLQSDASPLGRVMQQTMPDANWYVSMTEDGPEAYVSFLLEECDAEDKETFRKAVDEGLLAMREGFSDAQLEAEVAELEISTRLIGESDKLGINMLTNMIYYGINSGNPWSFIDYCDSLESIISWNQQGVFAELAERYLIGSNLTALSFTYPAPGEKEAKDAALAEKLQAIKAGMTDEEIAAIVEASNAPAQENPATADMVRELTAVTVASLPEEAPTWPITDETDENGVRRVDAEVAVQGIGEATILLDVSDTPQADIHWLRLFARLVGKMDTSAHTYEELVNLTMRYQYGNSFDLYYFSKDNGFDICLGYSWIGLNDELAQGYDLVRELIFDTRFDDTTRLADMINDNLKDLGAYINESGYSYEAVRALGRTVPEYRFLSYYYFLEYYDFLREVSAMCAENPQAVAERLEGIQKQVCNASNAIMTFAGDAEGIALNRTLADAFLAALENRPTEHAVYDLPAPAAREALIVNSAVQYNGIAADYGTLNMEGSTAALDVVTTLVKDLYLMPKLRTGYGAYGVYHYANDFGVTVYSYRDPGVRATYDVYEQLPDFLETLELDQETLDRYILSTYSDYAKPVGELSGAVAAINDLLDGKPQEKKLEDMRLLKAMTPETVKGYAEMYRALVEAGTRFTTGGAAAVHGAEDLFDAMLNPFAVADKTGVALTDVDEANPDYKDIRYVFEAGLMDAREDGSFGADEPALTGDLADALVKLTGEAAESPEAAVELLSGYGILLASDTADAPLTAWDCDDILRSFTALVGVQYPGGMAGEDEPFTRAALARALSSYAQWLDSLQAEAA